MTAAFERFYERGKDWRHTKDYITGTFDCAMAMRMNEAWRIDATLYPAMVKI